MQLCLMFSEYIFITGKLHLIDKSIKYLFNMFQTLF